MLFFPPEMFSPHPFLFTVPNYPVAPQRSRLQHSVICLLGTTIIRLTSSPDYRCHEDRDRFLRLQVTVPSMKSVLSQYLLSKLEEQLTDCLEGAASYFYLKSEGMMRGRKQRKLEDC